MTIKGKARVRLLAILLLISLLPLGAFANAESGLGLPPATQEGTITSACTLTLPEGLSDKAYRITDTLVETYLILPAKSALTIELPEAAQGLYLEWYLQPGSYQFEQYDASGTIVSTDAAQTFFNCYYPLSESTRRVQLSFDAETSLSSLYVYAAGATLPESVQQWAAAPEKTDLMIVAATVKTALSEFGTALAAYTAEHEVTTSLIVLSDDTRTNVSEFLSALWQMGVKTHPDFQWLNCTNNEIYKSVNAMWRKKTVTKLLTTAIADRTPRVVLTHAESSGFAAAQFTAEQVNSVAGGKKSAVEKLYAADASGSTVLPGDALISSGLTAAETVAKAYADCCISQLQFAPTLAPNTAFTLVKTGVGEDTTGDLFEHIDTASLHAYTEPTPAPTATPEPTPEPTATPEPAPTEAPAAPEAEGAAKVKKEGLFGYTVPLRVLTRILPTMGIGIVLTILSLLIFHDRIYKKYRRRRRRRKGKRVALLVGLAPVLLATVVSLVFLVLGLEKVEGNAPAAPSSAAEPAQEEAPPEEHIDEPAPAEEGEPAEAPADEGDAAEAATAATTPTDADQYFRTASDPAEVYSADYDAGHWEYKSDTLSILIDKHETTAAKGAAVYFVAHIRMRDVDSFRTTLSDADNKGDGLQKPWIVARRNSAVLLITGDNLVHMDTEFKGIMIRRGRVYQDKPGNATETMAMLPDMTMRTYPRRTTDATELLQDGVREAFSFGPTLIRGGEVQTNIEISRLKKENPRTGVGMVEPGHFVAIVVDGRQSDYSLGMLLPEFAELFKAEGCVEAYNLDGGVSTCMIFMGEQVNHHGVRQKNDNADDTYQRRIPDALIWGYSEQVPEESDPVTYTGELPG